MKTKEQFLQRKFARVIAGCLLGTTSLVIFLVLFRAGSAAGVPARAAPDAANTNTPTRGRRSG